MLSDMMARRNNNNISDGRKTRMVVRYHLPPLGDVLPFSPAQLHAYSAQLPKGT
jgi:hypothetical protein